MNAATSVPPWGSLRATLLSLQLLLLFGSSVAVAATPPSPSPADPNAAIFYSVIAGFTKKDPTWTPTTPLHNWLGVSGCPGANCAFAVPSLSQDGQGSLNLTLPSTFNYFTALTFSYTSLTGSIDLTHLPSGLQELTVSNNVNLTGSLDLTKLPAGLASLSLGSNAFTGSIDLTKLPSTLTALDVSANSLTGSLDFTQLPPSVTYLYFGTNNFSGSIDVTKFPATLVYLILQQNALTGSIDITALPSSMLVFNVRSNSLSGTIDATKLPSRLQSLLLSGNRFTGTIDLTQLPGAMGDIDVSQNSFSGTVDLTKFPSGLGNINLQQNGFTGTVDLLHLPATLEQFNISFNNFFGTPDFSRLPSQYLEGITVNNNNFSGSFDLTNVTATFDTRNGLTIDVNVAGNPLVYSVWFTPTRVSLTASPAAKQFTLALPATPMRSGFFTSPLSKRPLLLFATGYALLSTCQARVAWGMWVYDNTTGFVADSGVVAAALAPCLPSLGGGGSVSYQYVLRTAVGGLSFVLSNGSGLIFSRRA